MTVTTDPPGAQIFLKDYTAPDGAYELLGLTPLVRVPLPIGYKRFKIVKTGFKTVERTLPFFISKSAPADLNRRPPYEIKLDPEGSIPPGMIRVRADSDFVPVLYARGKMPALTLGDYLFDKFEVTNREYKKFMDNGGYRRPQFCRQKFIRDGKEVSREDAMKSFVDKSGRPGPAK